MANGVFGAHLREIIEALGLTQTDFAARLDVDQSLVARWLSGEREPGWSHLQRIVDVFHVNPQRLFEWK